VCEKLISPTHSLHKILEEAIHSNTKVTSQENGIIISYKAKDIYLLTWQLCMWL